jgi:PAS domain S-box-containing protein
MSDALLDALQVLPGGNAAVLSSLLEKVIDEVTHPVALYNRNGAIVAANQPFRAMHGFSAAEPLPESNVAAGLFEVTTLEGRQLSAEEWPLMRALAGEVVRDAELRVRRTDCEATWVARYSIRPICDARGETLLIVASAENIGTQKRMEEALRKSEIRTRSLVEANIIGVVSADIYGQVREANDEFLRITGFTHHDLTGGLVAGIRSRPRSICSRMSTPSRKRNCTARAGPTARNTSIARGTECRS